MKTATRQAESLIMENLIPLNKPKAKKDKDFF